MNEKTVDHNHPMSELYEVHKNSINWYISERFHPAEAVNKVLDGSCLDNEYEYQLRHLFGA